MNRYHDKELEQIARNAVSYFCEMPFDDCLKVLPGAKKLEKTIFATLKLVRDARLVGPSEQAIEGWLKDNFVTNSSGPRMAVYWLRSQLKLEPSPKMPTEADCTYWFHANDNLVHPNASGYVQWLPFYNWLHKQLGLGNK